MAPKKKKAAPKKKGKAVAKRKAPTPPVEQDMMERMEAAAGKGLENIGKDDTKIPFLRVLQGLSPQLQDGDPAYVDEAKPGMLMNSVTLECYPGSEGCLVIPVHYEKVYIEWKTREGGGGFVAQHMSKEAAEEALEEDGHEGNDIVDTAHHYCLIRSEVDEIWLPVVLPCKSTFLSASRGWNAVMKAAILRRRDGSAYPAASYSFMYGITTARQQNEKGTWYNLVIEKVSALEDMELFDMAELFRHSIVGGAAGPLAYDEEEDAEEAEAEDLPSF